jgi:diadenosine tetraphosphate (Ap4A) HIT family hydrolase
MHYHVHLIPRDRDKDGLTVFEWDLKPGKMDKIEKTAEKIMQGF